MLEAAQEFASGNASYRLLTLVGRNGCGKSHLLEAIARASLTRGEVVKYEFCPMLLDVLRNSYDPESEANYERVYGRYDSADLLVLDDLGAGRVTPWAREKLEMLIDNRYSGHGRLAIATNLRLDQMAQALGPRITDRVFDGRSGTVRVVVSAAASYRTGQRWN
jgi:DNA replication protein DnaC